MGPARAAVAAAEAAHRPARQGPPARLGGILWVLRTGAPWRDLPARFGPLRTVYSRFRRWQQAGVWDRILAIVQAEADARGDLDWDLHLIDGSVVRAHQHAAGAKGGTRQRTPSATVAADSAPNSTSAVTGAASRW